MYIFLIIIVVLIVLFVLVYNSIIWVKNSVEESFSAIDTVFQNRYDLIPNLVEVVKKYAEHEKNILEELTKIRSNMMSSEKLTKEKLEKENALSWTLKSIFALAENYPDLKANQNFIQLQNQWTEIEDRMQAARRSYNSAVKSLNDKKQMFPSNIIASIMNLNNYPMFEANKEAKNELNAKELFSK